MNLKPKSRKGIPNKDIGYIIDLCEKLKCDPVEILCHVANGDWKALGYKSPMVEKVGLGGKIIDEDRIQLDHRIDSAKKLMDFIYPKRKSIEIKDENGNDKGFVLAYNPANLKKVESEPKG